MKRPELFTLYGQVPHSCFDLAQRVMDLFLSDYDGYLNSYFAKVSKTDHGTFQYHDETLHLKDLKELLGRLQRECGGMWCTDINTPVAATQAYTSVFSTGDNNETTLVLSTEGELTDFLEKTKEIRAQYILFLTRIAIAIDSPWFCSAMRVVEWEPVTADRLLDRNWMGDSLYFVAWKEGVLKLETVAKKLGVASDIIKRSTMGYNFISFMPNE